MRFITINYKYTCLNIRNARWAPNFSVAKNLDKIVIIQRKQNFHGT